MITQHELNQIIADASSRYQVPEDVLADDRLSTEQKVVVLKQWAYDAKELETAEQENMRGSSHPTMLHRILLAIRSIKSEPRA
ncbi:MAG: putative cytosolic protein [uncultured bacterium]|nr:MAG: putative cytosolic protein [uncultured bacterium]